MHSIEEEDEDVVAQQSQGEVEEDAQLIGWRDSSQRDSYIADSFASLPKVSEH
jgi:hypothetical protein